MSNAQFTEALSLTQLPAESVLSFLENIEGLDLSPIQRQLVVRVQRDLVELQEAANARLCL